MIVYLLFRVILPSAVMLMVVVMSVANKDSSLKIEELKRYEDSRLDKGLMPEESDSMLVPFIVFISPILLLLLISYNWPIFPESL